MGRNARVKPKRLAEKLKASRANQGLTAESLIEKLNRPEINLYRSSITEFENGRREPPSLILLAYARLIGISTDVLIDDEFDLPESFKK